MYSLVHTVTTELCDRVAKQLTDAASNVVELCKRLNGNETNNKTPEIAEQTTNMVNRLEQSITLTLKQLQDLTLRNFEKCNGNIDVNQTDTVKKLNDLISKGFSNDQSIVLSRMQQYTDILLELMQQRVQGSNT